MTRSAVRSRLAPPRFACGFALRGYKMPEAFAKAASPAMTESLLPLAILEPRCGLAYSAASDIVDTGTTLSQPSRNRFNQARSATSYNARSAKC